MSEYTQIMARALRLRAQANRLEADAILKTDDRTIDPDKMMELRNDLIIKADSMDDVAGELERGQ